MQTFNLTESLSESTQQPYLCLQLTRDITAVLPMKNAQEVLMVSTRRITAIPNMPDCVVGLLNQRSRVFWVVDLPQMLEMPAIDRNLQQYHMAIIQAANVSLGLIVKDIKGVMRLTIEEIQSPIGNVSPGLIPYLQGCSLQQNEILLVLDAEAIVNSPILQNNL
ncbi:CheW protein [Stanieria sp. NIES-3757]|nr:CheW protein [Stanieria sp. NIES-3757]